MTKTDLIGTLALTTIVSGLIWTPLVLSYSVYQDTKRIEQNAILKAQSKINEEMTKVCKCWFTDSRCNVERVVVACQRPSFLENVP